MTLVCFLITIIMIINIVQSETKSCLPDVDCQCDLDGPCQLQCTGSQACKGSKSTITCTAYYPCTIVCDGQEACLDLTFNSGGATNLSLNCFGESACKTSHLHCNDVDRCDINCDDGGMSSSCEGMNLDCGSSSCNLECTGQDACNALIVAPITNAQSFGCTGVCTAEYIPEPTAKPTTSHPSKTPSTSDITSPSNRPSASPSIPPSIHPSTASKDPSHPTTFPTRYPSTSPIRDATVVPSVHPTIAPPRNPSRSPTNNPSIYPTIAPTNNPSKTPTDAPTTTRLHVPQNQPSLTSNPTYSFHSKEQIEITEAQSTAISDADSDTENAGSVFEIEWVPIAVIIASALCVLLLIGDIYFRVKKSKSAQRMSALSKHVETNVDSHELRNGEPQKVHIITAQSPSSGTAHLQFGEANVKGLYDDGLCSSDNAGEGVETHAMDIHEELQNDDDDDLDIISDVNTLGGGAVHDNEEEDDIILAGVNTLGGNEVYNTQELEDDEEDIIAGGNTLGEGDALDPPPPTHNNAMGFVHSAAEDEIIVGDDETDMG
eukprot:549463_1